MKEHSYRPTDREGNTYGIVLASGKRWAEQRRFFSQYLANSKDNFNDIIGDEASRLCNQGSIMWCIFIILHLFGLNSIIFGLNYRTKCLVMRLSTLKCVFFSKRLSEIAPADSRSLGAV